MDVLKLMALDRKAGYLFVEIPVESRGIFGVGWELQPNQLENSRGILVAEHGIDLKQMRHSLL